MNFLNMIFRLALSGVVFVFLVVIWAVVPYLDKTVDLDLTVISVFYGNTAPTGIVRDLLLASRGLFGMMIVVYIFIPAFLFFFQFAAEEYAKVLSLILGFLCIGAFFASLIVYQLFHL